MKTTMVGIMQNLQMHQSSSLLQLSATTIHTDDHPETSCTSINHRPTSFVNCPAHTVFLKAETETIWQKFTWTSLTFESHLRSICVTHYVILWMLFCMHFTNEIINTLSFNLTDIHATGTKSQITEVRLLTFLHLICTVIYDTSIRR